MSRQISFYTHDKINYLRRIHRVLAEDVAAEEARIKAGSRWSTTCDPSEVDQVFDEYLDPLCLLYGSVQSLGHQLVVVGLASLIENTVRLLLAQKGVVRRFRNFGDLATEFANQYPHDLGSAADYPYANLIRALSNDFKHRDGWTPDNGETFQVAQQHRALFGTDFVGMTRTGTGFTGGNGMALRGAIRSIVVVRRSAVISTPSIPLPSMHGTTPSALTIIFGRPLSHDLVATSRWHSPRISMTHCLGPFTGGRSARTSASFTGGILISNL